MAYGKIKADAVIYDNSGSDVEKSISDLANPEGTEILSTGEGGTIKFLRTDGDGTCSWHVPVDTNTQLSNEQVQDIVGAMVTGNTETDITVTYEDSDGTLDFVVGTLNQDTTGTAALATEATNVTAVANNSTDETVYPTFVDGTTGTQGIETDSSLTYNPSTGLLSAGALTLSGNLIVGGSTTTISSTTIEVTDKNIEIGKVGTPTDTTADGGGITLKGATDKTINWVNSSDLWTSSEGWDLASGKSYHINNTSVLNATTLGSGVVNSSLTSVGTLTGLDLTGQLTEHVTITAGKLSDNLNLDTANGNVFYFTTAETTTAVPNIRYNSSTTLDSKLGVGDSLAITVLTTAAAAGFSAQWTIDGSAVTEKWIGGSAVTAGSASGIDMYGLTIIKTAANTFTVLISFNNAA